MNHAFFWDPLGNHVLHDFAVLFAHSPYHMVKRHVLEDDSL